MPLSYRPALDSDIPACVDLRGRTRQNAISAARLAEMGITVASWAADVRSGVLPGHVCLDGDRIAGYCFGDKASGEVVVLALLPDYESRGIGRHLLDLVVQQLHGFGHRRLFLGCAADPAARSHGFYRHLGWVSTGRFDRAGDEVLEFFPQAGDSRAGGSAMAIQLDHTIVPSHSRDASARRLAELLGVPCGPAREGPFFAVYVNPTLTLDFIQTDEPFPIYHFCFHVGEDEFDQILARIQQAGLPYRSDVRGPMDRQINTHYGGRMIYWNEPDGHQWEMLTVSYARQ